MQICSYYQKYKEFTSASKISGVLPNLVLLLTILSYTIHILLQCYLGTLIEDKFTQMATK